MKKRFINKSIHTKRVFFLSLIVILFFITIGYARLENNLSIVGNIRVANYYPIYTVTLNNQNATTSGTTEIYERYRDNWYQDSNATNLLTKITRPTKDGYFFDGYYTEPNGQGTMIINKSGEIVSDSLLTRHNITIYASWITTIYLYQNGNEYTDFTGGWTFNLIETNAEGHKNSDNLYLGYSDVGTSGGEFCIENSIPPGNYKAHIYYYKETAASDYWGYSYIQFGSQYRMSIGDSTIGYHDETFNIELNDWSKFVFGNYDSKDYIYEVYLTANQIEDNRIYIEFDLNGGFIDYGELSPITEMEMQTLISGNRMILNPRVPSKTGYTFKGWNTNKNATTSMYSPGEEYTFNNNLKLYAVWEKT